MNIPKMLDVNTVVLVVAMCALLYALVVMYQAVEAYHAAYELQRLGCKTIGGAAFNITLP